MDGLPIPVRVQLAKGPRAAGYGPSVFFLICMGKDMPRFRAMVFTCTSV